MVTLDKIINKACVLIAVNGCDIVGYCAFYMNDFTSNTVYISLIAVDKNWQGKHVGKQILDYIKMIAKINEFHKIKLEVDKENKRGILFYTHNQFYYEKEASVNSRYMVFDL